MLPIRKASASGLPPPSWDDHNLRNGEPSRNSSGKIATFPTSMLGCRPTLVERRLLSIGFAYVCSQDDACNQWSDIRLVFERAPQRRSTLEAFVQHELTTSLGVQPDVLQAQTTDFVDSLDQTSADDWAQVHFEWEPSATFSELSPSMQGDLLKFVDAGVSDLQGLTLRGVDLRNVDLRSGPMIEANWSEVDARDADFTDANLSHASLHRVSFANACLQNARLESLRRLNVNFSGADLSGATMSLDMDWLLGPPELATQARPHFEMLMSEADGWCLLASIASIDNRYAELKRSLICQLIEAMEARSLSETMVWTSIASWVSVLSDPVMWGSPLISAFIAEYMPVGVQASWNRRPIPGDLPVGQLRYHIEHLLQAADRPQWAVRRQGAIHQLILRARATGQLDDLANALLDAHLRHEAVRPVAHALDDVVPDTAQETCIFLAEDALSAIACTQKLVQAVIDEQDDIPWQRFYVLRRDTPDARFAVVPCDSPEAALRLTPLLHGPYLADSGAAQRRFAKLLDAYWPEDGARIGAPPSMDAVDGRSAKSDDPPEVSLANERDRYRHRALDMSTRISTPHPAHKLTDDDWQMRLLRIFASAIVTPARTHTSPAAERASMRLTPAVKSALWQVCRSEIPGLADDARTRAAFALIEAIKMTQLSSSLFFGSESVSPVALRVLASALLNEVAADDPDLIPVGTHRQWMASLVGDTVEMATCTATLADDMMAFVRATPVESPLREIHDALLPHPWRR